MWGWNCSTNPAGCACTWILDQVETLRRMANQAGARVSAQVHRAAVRKVSAVLEQIEVEGKNSDRFDWFTARNAYCFCPG